MKMDKVNYLDFDSDTVYIRGFVGHDYPSTERLNPISVNMLVDIYREYFEEKGYLLYQFFNDCKNYLIGDENLFHVKTIYSDINYIFYKKKSYIMDNYENEKDIIKITCSDENNRVIFLIDKLTTNFKIIKFELINEPYY